MSDMDSRKDEATKWFRQLRDDICRRFEEIEDAGGDTQLGAVQLGDAQKAGRFQSKIWDRAEGGGGEMNLLHGRIFEKVGVNISIVHGAFSDEFAKTIPGTETDSRFWAAGISVVAHPQNPFVPAAHMNCRFIVTQKSWFGGGGDLTPLMPAAAASKQFHADLKAICDSHNPDYYPKYKALCDEYFHLKHRGESRGDGGIFYDYLDSGDWQADFAFTRDVGQGFCDSYCAIVGGLMHKKWSEADRHHQLVRRGRYVEFNLLYDRGTLFGLKTGGNIEAILMSMPPEVRWP